MHNRILVADDDLVVRGSLAAVLESEGYIVDEARNGIEAVTRSIQHVPDPVLLDLNMPHWDGWTAFSQLDRVRPFFNSPAIVQALRPRSVAVERKRPFRDKSPEVNAGKPTLRLPGGVKG